MFGDDFFDEIERAFFNTGRTSSHGNVVKSESEERVIDYIVEDDFVYFVFELTGYSQEDVSVDVKKGELIVSAIKENLENVKPELKSKLGKGVYFNKEIPVKIDKKSFEKTFCNGVLEVKFKRK